MVYMGSACVNCSFDAHVLGGWCLSSIIKGFSLSGQDSGIYISGQALNIGMVKDDCGGYFNTKAGLYVVFKSSAPKLSMPFCIRGSFGRTCASSNFRNTYIDVTYQKKILFPTMLLFIVAL